MVKLFSYWKNHIVMITFVLMLLIVQAYCDLELPNYTADIVDVGISNYGIENSAPEKMSETLYKLIDSFLDGEEKEIFENSYDRNDEGLYRLNTINEKKINRVADIAGTTIVVISGMERSMETDAAGILAMVESGKMTKEQLMGAKTEFIEKMGKMSDTIVPNQAISYIKGEYERIGMDVGDMQTHYILITGLKMLGLAVLGMLAAIFAGYLASIVGARVGMSLRDSMFKKVISFSKAEMDKFSTASLITRCTNDIQQVQGITIMLLRMVMYAPILAIGGIFKVIATKTGMDWIIVVAVVVIVGVVFTLMAIALPKFKVMQTLMDRMNLVSREILTGVFVIRAFGREKQEEERFEKANKELMSTQLFTNRVMTFMMPIMMFIMNAVAVLIVWMGAKGIDKGNIMIGDMMAFITYTMQIIISFLMMTMLSIMLPRAGVAAGRIDEVLTTDISIDDSDKAEDNDKKLDDVKGVIRFEDVSFKYPGGEEDALEHLSFCAEPGKTTAIIGSTGCGKSTLIHLIPRFYDVTEGKITIDGVDIRDISQNKLRSLIGFVPQKGVLFSGDIESNIKFGGEKITDEDMKLAAEIAQASEFINEKPENFKSEIAQGGTNVSGGQKQRLSIARAIATKAKIFLFDDSFSALDYKTDVVLRKALKENISDSTIIIVAQRISTILNADQIIVLDEGRIVGKGSHEELMNSCEAYMEIAKSQLSESELKGGRA